MNYTPILGIALSLLISCQCQQHYQNGEYNNQEENFNYQRTPPPPQILSHKQALNHDGNFKYIFTSENGLAQGETIAPDGSRNGGYSYIDPNGKKISVKYTAGKEGFKILEADHLPKAPQPVASLPVPVQHQPYQPQPAYQPQPQYREQKAQQYQAQPQYQQLAYNYRPQQEDDGQYRPEVYEKSQSQVAAYPRPAYPSRIQVSPTPSSNALEEKDYYDEPGKANSFGNGYLFEFSG